MNFICKYCSKQCKNTNSLRNHERLCKSNPNHQIIKSSGFKQYNIDLKSGKITKTYSNQFDKAGQLRLPIPVVGEKKPTNLSVKALRHVNIQIQDIELGKFDITNIRGL